MLHFFLNKVLQPVIEGQEVDQIDQTKYRSGVGKLLHMMRWSRPDIWNSVRELSRRMSKCNKAHIKAMHRVMKYCSETPNRGWTLKPERKWDGKSKTFEFRIVGKSDSNFSTCTETRRSVTGYVVYLEGAAVAAKSGMQKIVAISVTEAEFIALVQCVQEMLYSKKVLESMELKVELPMIIKCDNKGAVDLANGWSIGGGTKHMDVRVAFIRELKEEKILKVEWIATKDNTADIFTKNVDNIYELFIPYFVFHLGR